MRETVNKLAIAYNAMSVPAKDPLDRTPASPKASSIGNTGIGLSPHVAIEQTDGRIERTLLCLYAHAHVVCAIMCANQNKMRFRGRLRGQCGKRLIQTKSNVKEVELARELEMPDQLCEVRQGRKVDAML